MSDQLPIKEIFLRGIEMPFKRHKELIRLGWPYAFLVLGSSFILEDINGIFLNITYIALLCFTGVLGIVGWHRTFLLPTKAVTETATVRWDHRETKFLLCFLSIGIISSIVLLIPFLIITLNLNFFVHKDNSVVTYLTVQALLMVPAYYLVSRLSLILPDSAVDNDHPLSWAWNISADHHFRLFILVGAIPWLTSLIFELLIAFVEPSYILNLLQNSVFLVVFVIEVCLLSLAYEWIVSRQQPVTDDEQTPSDL